MLKKIMLLAVLALAGCDDKTEVFGIEIGGSLQTIRDKHLVVKEDIIPSDQHFVMVDLSRAPKNDMGDMAKYSAYVLNDEIIGATANIKDEQGQYFNSMVSYATKILGNPIATNDGIHDTHKAEVSPYGCVTLHTCSMSKYAVFRKNNINALVANEDGKSRIQFDSDKIKDAMNLK